MSIDTETLTLPRAGDEQVPLGQEVTPYESFLDRAIFSDGRSVGLTYGVGRVIENYVVQPDSTEANSVGRGDLNARVVLEMGLNPANHPLITDEMRQETLENIQTEQRNELREWFNYLDGHSSYPDDFKLYIWKSVVTTSSEYSGTFLRSLRPTSSLTHFPRLNPEALSYVYDVYSGDTLKETSSKRLDELYKMQGRTFDVLYSKALSIAEALQPIDNANESERNRRRRLEPTLSISNGEWREFSQDEQRELADSTRGQHTGWEIAGEKVAESYLDNSGQFIVYYSSGEGRVKGGDYSVPRVAIRMQDGEVADVMINDDLGLVRNVLSDNPRIARANLEILDKITQQLGSLPGGAEFVEKLESIRRLLDIQSRFSQLEALNENATASAEQSAQEIERIGSLPADERIKHAQKYATYMFRRLLRDRDPSTVTEEYRDSVRASINSTLLKIRSLEGEEATAYYKEWADNVRRVNLQGVGDDDLKFLYEINEEIPRLNDETDDLIDKVRKTHVEKFWQADQPELVRLSEEFVRDQLDGSLDAYAEMLSDVEDEKRGRSGKLRKVGHVATRLIASIDRRSKYSLNGAFDKKDKEWTESGVYEYIADQLKEGIHYTLVSTPGEIRADIASIKHIAESFSTGNSHVDTETLDGYYPETGYEENQLSGSSGRESIRFSLMPNKPNSRQGQRNIEQQRADLKEIKEAHPKLHIQVPSVMTALAYWRALRNRGVDLSGTGAYDRTYIEHANLDPHSIHGQEAVPATFVDNNGLATVYWSRTNSLHPSRFEIS